MEISHNSHWQNPNSDPGTTAVHLTMCYSVCSILKVHLNWWFWIKKKLPFREGYKIEQECIPVGCVPSAAVAVSRGGGCSCPGGVPGPGGVPVRRGVPGLGGCTWSGGCTCPGGVPGLGGAPGWEGVPGPWGCTWSRGGVPGPRGVYLVRYSPQLWTDTRL